ncbi:MAG TPA: aldo/keto reductase [Acidocella sp.]|jgi:aryl-alcohol dehydrogenase-like predicted oxidoreductase|nr:aldo/keto reductase [Acidocella sp.]
MRTKELGRSGLRLPSIMFGGNVLGWTADTATSFRLLDALMDAGLNAIDTADAYSRWAPGHKGGESEAIIGVWMKERKNRDKVIVATKVGMDLGEGKSGLSAKRIEYAVEASLIRLQTDYIDLYQAHKDDEATPLEETLEAFGKLVKAGKVRVLGASNYTAPRLRKALEVSERLGLPRYESLQPHYNLAERAIFEDELGPLCREQQVGVITYYSLASGFLSGKYRSAADAQNKPRSAGVQKYLNEKGFALLKVLDAQAARLKATPAQIALAWLIARPEVTAPIASATSLEQLQDLAKASRLSLDAEAIQALDTASAGF